MSWLKQLWLLRRWHRMLTLAERQYIKAAWEQVEGQLSLHAAFTESAERFEARAAYFQAEYVRVRDHRAPVRAEMTS
jgi:hypothetical protein